MKKIFLLIFFCCTLLQSAFSQIFYKVEGNGLEVPSYIFGSHHLAPLEILSTTGADRYIDEVSQVVGEIDLSADPISMAMAMQSHMMAPADSTLSQVISPEDLDIISEEFKKWSPAPGMELSMFDMMKPMVISTMVTMKMVSKLMPDFDPTQQIDSYVLTTGKNKGKKIIPLETPEFQATVLYDSTPISYQAEALVEILKQPEKSIENATKLNKAYEEQDLDSMLKMSEEDDEHPEFMRAILDNRNANWLTIMPEIFKEGSTFVVVGALHLAGENGIIQGLKNLGYSVSPVTF